jgi:hypothetical protein
MMLISLILCCGTPPTFAGLYTDDLSRCLVESTSSADKITLVRWIFAGMSQHPAVASLSKATPADIDRANAETGALFMRLLADTCKDKSSKAIRYEGAVAIQGAFAVLGQVATAELFAAPEVQKVMAGLDKHLDSKKLEGLAAKDP